jgi:MATE family multidrug resistance protein
MLLIHTLRAMFFTYYKKDMRDTIRLAYPVVIGQLGHMMMGVVDSMMVGRVGAVPLAAASVANSLFLLILVFGLGSSMALSPIVAMARGAGRSDQCSVIFRQGIMVNVFISIVLLLLTVISAYGIQHLNQPPEVVEQAVVYLQILGASIIPIMVFQSYRQFIEGFEIMKPAMVIALLMNILNVLANWAFIFGHLGLPAMGLRGAGIATFITRMGLAVTIALYAYHSKRFKHYHTLQWFKGVDMAVIKQILKIGIPSGFQYFFEIGAFTGSVILIGWLGYHQLAAHQIAINMAAITFMFAFGISAAAAIRVGNAAGRKDKIATRRAGIAAIILSVCLMAFFGLLFMLFRHRLPSFYIDNVQVISIASSLLIIAAFFQVSDGIQAVGIGILRGMADVKIPTFITFVAYWLIGLPGGYFLGFVFDLGVRGIWWGFVLALSASAFMLTARFVMINR